MKTLHRRLSLKLNKPSKSPRRIGQDTTPKGVITPRINLALLSFNGKKGAIGTGKELKDISTFTELSENENVEGIHCPPLKTIKETVPQKVIKPRLVIKELFLDKENTRNVNSQWTHVKNGWHRRRSIHSRNRSGSQYFYEKF